MPNWCEGSLKIRGTLKDLKVFVLQGLKPVGFFGEDLNSIRITDEDDTYFNTDVSKSTLWLDGTRRHFCEPDYIEVYADSPDDITVMVLPMKAAWGIDAESLQDLCKRFNVDMKIQGFEMGMQFSQIVEIVGGEILQDKEIQYDDWDWDCPCPRMGG